MYENIRYKLLNKRIPPPGQGPTVASQKRSNNQPPGLGFHDVLSCLNLVSTSVLTRTYENMEEHKSGSTLPLADPDGQLET